MFAFCPRADQSLPIPTMRRLNVVFMGNLLYPEGLADTKRFQHFVDGVRSRADATVRILLLRQSHPGRDPARLEGVHRGVPYGTIGHDLRPGAGAAAGYGRFLRAGFRSLREAFRPGEANVLFLYGEPNLESIPFVLRARRLGYRVVVDIVEDAYFIPEQAPLLSRLKAASVRWTTRHLHWFADGVVVISTYLRDKLEGIVGGRLPVALIPISVDLARVPVSGGGFHRPARLLYAGNFGEKDDLEGLIGAFERIVAGGGDVELLLTGRGVAARMAEVQARIAASPAAGRIRYLGYLPDDDYFRLLGDCDIPCVVRAPSAFADRGFPFKLGEYLASGRPVVASRVSDVPAYLADRESAMLVEPGSASGIESALRYLLADEARALALGRAGREVAAAHFAAEGNGRRLLDLIARITPP